ncbi:hypothetical protein [Pseudalkalibacillus sp. SCS-8]|uniref:hypothetical protein n=1 Tax=Pseudalkalibacillus nanhaiensis TaxID=3115291 RepID=UPI0032D9C01D
MKFNQIGSLGVILFVLSGCQFTQDRSIQPVQILSKPDSFQAIEVTNTTSELTMTVRHMVANGNVFVECYVPGFTFTDKGKSNDPKKGHLAISIDHQKPYPVHKAAFIVKNLSKGNHHIKITLVNGEGEKIDGMEKQLFIQIP